MYMYMYVHAYTLYMFVYHVSIMSVIREQIFVRGVEVNLPYKNNLFLFTLPQK